MAPGFAGMSTGVKASWSNTGFCGFKGLDFLPNDFLMSGGDPEEGEGGRMSSPSPSPSLSPPLSSSPSSSSSSESSPGPSLGWDNSHSTARVASPSDRSSAARAFLAENPISIILSAPGGRGPLPLPSRLFFFFFFFLSADELRGCRSWRPFRPTSAVPLNDPSDTGGGDILFARGGIPNMDDGLPTPTPPLPLLLRGFGSPVGGGGRPATDFLLLGVGVRTDPGGGAAPDGGLALAAPAAAAAANDDDDPPAGVKTSTPDAGELSAVGLPIPAPARLGGACCCFSSLSSPAM